MKSRRTFGKVAKPVPPPPPPDPVIGLMSRCLNWATQSQSDGTLDGILADAGREKVVSRLLDQLPTGSGTTGERLAVVRRRLERAEAK